MLRKGQGRSDLFHPLGLERESQWWIVCDTWIRISIIIQVPYVHSYYNKHKKAPGFGRPRMTRFWKGYSTVLNISGALLFISIIFFPPRVDFYIANFKIILKKLSLLDVYSDPSYIWSSRVHILILVKVRVSASAFELMLNVDLWSFFFSIYFLPTTIQILCNHDYYVIHNPIKKFFVVGFINWQCLLSSTMLT